MLLLVSVSLPGGSDVTSKVHLSVVFHLWWIKRMTVALEEKTPRTVWEGIRDESSLQDVLSDD